MSDAAEVVRMVLRTVSWALRVDRHLKSGCRLLHRDESIPPIGCSFVSERTLDEIAISFWIRICDSVVRYRFNGVLGRVRR